MEIASVFCLPFRLAAGRARKEPDLMMPARHAAQPRSPLRAVGHVVAVLAVALPASAGEPWKERLEAGLEAAYPLSKRAALDPDRITTTGVVLVVRKDGITGDVSTDLRYSVTYVRDGHVSQQGGMTTALFTKQRSRTFKPGERVYVTDVKVADDYVRLLVLSVDMFEIAEKGSTKQRRYMAALQFPFSAGALEIADAVAVRALIEPVLADEAALAAAPPKTVALGQSRDEVEAVLGKPGKVIDLGVKVIYVYPDLNVVFEGGKVATVE